MESSPNSKLTERNCIEIPQAAGRATVQTEPAHIIPLVKSNIQKTKVQMKSEDNYRVLSKYLTENKKPFTRIS